jgi:hypothetical protein
MIFLEHFTMGLFPMALNLRLAKILWMWLFLAHGFGLKVSSIVLHIKHKAVILVNNTVKDRVETPGCGKSLLLKGIAFLPVPIHVAVQSFFTGYTGADGDICSSCLMPHCGPFPKDVTGLAVRIRWRIGKGTYHCLLTSDFRCSSISFLVSAPVSFLKSLLFLKSRNVGVLLIAYRETVRRFSSTFTFAILTPPAYRGAISSSRGRTIRQETHHGAQQQMKTGPGKEFISLSNVLSDMSRTYP